MADINYQEPSKEFAFAYNHETQDTKWASRLQDNTFANNSTTEQTQQNKFLIPKEEFEKKLEEFKQNYLPKPYGGLEWHEFKDKYTIKTKNDKDEEISIIQAEFEKQFKDNQLSYVLIKYPYIPNLIRKENFDSYERTENKKLITKPLKTNAFNYITAREAIDAYKSLDQLHPAYVAVWFHNHPIEGELLLSNLPVEAQRLPKISLVRGFQEQQAEPAKEKKLDEKTGKEKEEINYDLAPKTTNNLDTLINTIKKELALNKEDTNMLSLLADIVVEAGLENDMRKKLENVEGKDKFLNFLNQNEEEYKLRKSDEGIDKNNLGKESNFLEKQELTENLDSTVKGLATLGVGYAAELTALAFINLPAFLIILGGLAVVGGLGWLFKKPLTRSFLRKRSLAKLQKRALGMSTLGGSLMGLELSEKMNAPKDETNQQAYQEWLKTNNLEQEKAENRNNRKFQENITKLENGDVSIYFDNQLKTFKLAAMALPVAQTSTLFSDMSVRSKAGFFKHVYLKGDIGKDGDDSLLDLYVGDVLMENLRFIFPESTYGIGRLKAKNLHIQLRHQDLTNTTNLNSLIQGAIFMLMYRMMTDSGQISASADLLHKALGQNIHEGMALDANAQSIAIENFYGTDYGKIGKIELGGDSPEDNVNISVTTKTNPDLAQDQNIPNKKFLAEKKGELEELRNELQSKKSDKSTKPKKTQKLEKKIQAVEQEIAKPEKEVLDSELKSQVNVSLTTNKLRFEEADMISSMVADIAKAKLGELGMKFENLKGLENFRVNGLKLGSNMSPQAITDLFFSSNEIIFDALEADEFAYAIKDETKKDDKGKPLSTPTMSIKGCKTKMEGVKLDFYMKYPDYKVGEKFNEDDLPFEKLQIKKLHIPLTSIEDFHVVDEQSHVELTRLNGLSFIRDISIGTELDAKGLEAFSLKVGQIDQQNKEQKDQTQNNFAFKTNDMDLNGKFTLNSISGIDYKLNTQTGKYTDLEGKEQSKRLMNHTMKLGGLSLGKSELSAFNMGKPSDSTYISSKKGDVVSLEGIDVKGFEIDMEEEFMSDVEQQEEHKVKKLEDKTYKEAYKYDPAKTKLVPKSIYLQELNIAQVKGGNLKVNINDINEKTKKVTPQFAIDLGKDGFLENVKISNVQYDGKMGDDFLAHLTSGMLEMNAFKAPTMIMGVLGKLHKTETGSISVRRFYNGTSADQRGATFSIKDFKSKFDQPKDKKGDLLDVSAGADLDGMIYDNGRFILKSDSHFTIPRLHWKSGENEIISNAPAGIDGISVDVQPLGNNLYQINQFQLKEIHVQNLTIISKGFKMEFPKQYKTTIPNIWMQGLLNKKTLSYVGKGGLKNGFDWNEVKMSLYQDIHHFFRTNMALQAEQLDFERKADGSIEFGMTGFKSGLNKNSSNENSLYWDGLSLNTPLENSLVTDPKKPNQASLFNADKITFQGKPDKDVDGESIMRKTIIMENPTLNFLPLKGNIYAKNSLGKPSGLSGIELQDLLLNGKTKGKLIAEQVKMDLGNDHYGATKYDSNIALKQARGEEDVWKITAEGGEFELDNLNANVHNMETLSEIFSDKEKDKNLAEKKKEPFKNQDFDFLDNFGGSYIDIFVYGKPTRLNVSYFDKDSQSFKEKDRNDKTKGAYVNIAGFLKEFKTTFLQNIKLRHIQIVSNAGSMLFETLNAITNLFLDFDIHKIWDESGHLIEHALEKSLQNELVIEEKSGQTYVRLSSLAALFSGNASLDIEILKDFLTQKYIKKAANRIMETVFNPTSIITDELTEDWGKEKRQEKERKDFDKFYNESLEEKLKDNSNKNKNNSTTQEKQTTQQNSKQVPTIEEIYKDYQLKLAIAKAMPLTPTLLPSKIGYYATEVMPSYLKFLMEMLIYSVFVEFRMINPSMSLYVDYEKNAGTNGSIMGNNGMVDMKEAVAQLSIGQKIDAKERPLYGLDNKKHFTLYDFIHYPTITLSNLAIKDLNVPIKSEQIVPNTYGIGTYSVTDQIIKIKNLNLNSLELSHLKGWGYDDVRNGRVGDIIQKSKIQARGSGAKISGFEMILRQQTKKDTPVK